MLSKEKIGYFEGIFSAVLNVILFILKLWVGSTSGSIAVVADAWHTLSDTLTSIIVIFGIWISSKPKDKEHPFGHGRAELVASIIIGVLLALVGFNFLKESILQLRTHAQVDYKLPVIIVFAISVLLKEAIARYSIYYGKKFDLMPLVADGWHHRSDAIASALILVGAFLGKYMWWIDGVLGICVSILIIRVSYSIVKDATNRILGEPADPTLIEDIRIIAAKHVPEMRDIHDIRVHKYGENIEATLHLRLPKMMSLENAHTLTSRLEVLIMEERKISATIHTEPET